MSSNNRPRLLSEFTGQGHFIPALKLEVDTARMRNETFPHTVFTGASGTGKTTLAEIVANELKRDFRPLYARGLGTDVLVQQLASVEANTLVFVDEIHRLSKATQDALFTAMEDFHMDTVLKHSGAYRVELPPFTLIGATTRLGMLQEPLRNRFKLHFDLRRYDDVVMADIVGFHMKANNLRPRDDRVAAELVRLCHGTARIAQSTCQNLAKVKLVRNNDGLVTLEDVTTYRELYGIDENGLTENALHYLRTLRQYSKLSLSALTSIMGSERDVLTEIIEPNLIRLGLVEITSRGREITDAGKSYGE